MSTGKRIFYALILSVLLLIPYFLFQYAFDGAQEFVDNADIQSSIRTRQIMGLDASLVDIDMGYIPNMQFAPFYVASDSNYFLAEGVSPTFKHGFSTDIVTQVGLGNAQFAVTDGEQVLIARSQGIPVVSILALYPEAPVGIVSLAQKGIHSAADLRGKTIGVPALYGTSYHVLLAYLANQEVAESDVNILNIGFAQVEAVENEQVDAAVVFLNNEKVILESRGAVLNTLDFSDAIDFVGSVLITNEDTINTQGVIVGGVVRGTRKGMESALKQSSEAYRIAKRTIMEFDENQEVGNEQRQVLTESSKRWVNIALSGGEKDTPADPYKTLGQQTPEIWEATKAALQAQSALSDIDVDVESAFTNQFLLAGGQ